MEFLVGLVVLACMTPVFWLVYRGGAWIANRFLGGPLRETAGTGDKWGFFAVGVFTCVLLALAFGIVSLIGGIFV